MQKWTQDEAIAFECAREVISDWMAIHTGKIYDEEAKENPDNELIENLRAERSRLFNERANLRLKNHEMVSRVRSEYGALVRAWRMRHSNNEEVGV